MLDSIQVVSVVSININIIIEHILKLFYPTDPPTIISLIL